MLKLYDIYGGHREEVKLMEEIAKLDLVPYTMQTGDAAGETYLVPSDELQDHLLTT